MTSLEQQFLHFRRTGDPDALAAVYDATAPRLLRTALHLVGSASEAEDALQAAFVAAIERRATYDAGRPLLPWLVGIVANQARLLRSRRDRSPDPQRAAALPSEDPAEAASALEFTATVDEAIDRLPETYRSVLVLHLRHGLPPADIAHALRRPPGTVRAQLLRGLEKLRALLPASLAGSIVLVTGGRGLAAVRAEVVRHATTTVPLAASGAAAVLGALAMKKILIGVVAAAALALGWFRPWATPVELPGADAASAGVAAASAAVVPAKPLGIAPKTGPTPETALASARTSVPQEHAVAAGSQRAGELRGRAVWADDETPAAGITVWCRRLDATQLQEREIARTDAGGHFRLPRIDGAALQLGTDRGGELLVPSLVSPELAAGTTKDVVIFVPHGLDLSGRVVDEAGHPVPGAGLWLSEWNLPEVGLVVATCDADGRFALRSVGEKRYIGARASGYAPSRVQYLDGLQQREIELVLVRGGASVHGRASTSDGTPLPGARVRIAPPGEPAQTTLPTGVLASAWTAAHAVTDDAGSFAVDGLPPGTLTVQVRAPAFGVSLTTIEVAAGETAEVEAVLPAAASIRGEVRRQDGTPSSGAIVKVGGWLDFAHARASVHEDGTYLLRDVTPGEVLVELVLGNAGVVRERLVLRPGEDRRWDVVLRDHPSIDGVVVDDTGLPMAGLQILLFRERECVGSASTDRDGGFAFADLVVTPHRVLVQCRVRGNVVAGLGDVGLTSLDDVMPGAAPLRIQIAADRRPASGVRGRVVDGANQRGQAARVVVGNMDGAGAVTLAADAESGVFAVEGLVSGPYWITVRSEGRPELAVGRRMLEQGKCLDLGELRLRSGVTVQGDLLLPAVGAGPARVEVYAADSNQRLADAVVDGDTFRSDPLAPGRYRLLVTGTGLASTALPFEVVDGVTPSRLRVAIDAGMQRRIVAHLPPGTPVPEWVALSLLRGTESLGGAVLQPRDEITYACELWLGAADHRVLIGTAGGHWFGEATVVAGGSGDVHVALRARR